MGSFAITLIVEIRRRAHIPFDFALRRALFVRTSLIYLRPIRRPDTDYREIWGVSILYAARFNGDSTRQYSEPGRCMAGLLFCSLALAGGLDRLWPRLGSFISPTDVARSGPGGSYLPGQGYRRTCTGQAQARRH